MIGDNVEVTVLRISGNRVSLGIKAGNETRIIRAELKSHSQRWCMSDDFFPRRRCRRSQLDLESIGVAEPVAPEKRATRSAAAVEQPAAMPEATVKGDRSSFFDIETVPDEERMASFDLPELRRFQVFRPSGAESHVELLKATVAEIVEKLKSIVAPKAISRNAGRHRKAGKNRDGVYKGDRRGGDDARQRRKTACGSDQVAFDDAGYCKIVSMAVCRARKVTCSVVGQSDNEGPGYGKLVAAFLLGCALPLSKDRQVQHCRFRSAGNLLAVGAARRAAVEDRRDALEGSSARSLSAAISQ